MKKLYEAANLPEAQLLKDRLAEAGIETILQGEYLTGALGELPVNTYPTLWLMQDSDEARAREALNAIVGVLPNKEEWRCSKCGEWHNGQFSQCWHCGAERP